jgi:hypothetical protein
MMLTDYFTKKHYLRFEGVKNYYAMKERGDDVSDISEPNITVEELGRQLDPINVRDVVARQVKRYL